MMMPSAGLPADDQVKGALCAVIDHLPELGAVVCFAADMAIHILAQDGHAMGADVGLAVPALALDGLLRLAAAARRSGSRRQGGAVCSLFFWPQKLLADLLADAHEVWYTGCVSRQRGIDCVVFLRHAPHARPGGLYCTRLPGFFLHKRPRWWKHWRGRLVMYQHAGGRRV